MRCKFCGKEIESESELSEEHIFPAAIGGKIKLFPVHKHCNSVLGNSIDVFLTDNRAVLVRRLEFDLRGNSGQLPNPLDGVTLRCQKDDPFVYDPKKGFRRVRDVFKTPDSISIIFEVEPGVDIAIQLEKFIEKVQAKFARMNQYVPTREEILSQYKESYEEHKLEADVSIKPSAHWPALIKIAYELGVYWLGDSYLDDPKGIELRNFVIDPPETYAFLGDLEVVDSDKMSLWDVFNQPKKNHIAIMQKVENAIVLKARIFDTFEITAVITENGNLYTSENKFLAIDPRNKSFEERELRHAYGVISQVKPSIHNGAWLDVNDWFRQKRSK